MRPFIFRYYLHLTQYHNFWGIKAVVLPVLSAFCACVVLNILDHFVTAQEILDEFLREFGLDL